MRSQHPDLSVSYANERTDVLALFLNNSEEICLLLDRNFNVVLFNEQAATYTREGSGIELYNGISIFELAPTTIHEETRQIFSKVLEGHSISYEQKLPKSDGVVLHFSHLLKPAINSTGEIEGILTITKDITDKRLAEEKVAESRRNLDLLLDNTDESFIMIDKAWKVILFNKKAFEYVKRFFNIELGLGINFLDIVQPHRREIVSFVVKNTFDGKEQELELPLTYDGHPIYISNKYKPVFSHNKEVIAIIITSKDDTTKKIYEETLKDAEERWRFALESSHQGVWDWNIETGNIFYSPSLKKIYGMEEHEEGSYDFWASRLHPDDKDQILQESASILEKSTDFSESSYRFLARDNYIWVKDRGLIVKRDKHGKPLRVIGTTTDITSQKNAEIALKEAEERWRFALEGGNQGVWDWNLNTNEVFFSPSFKKLYGFNEEELKNTYDQWQSRVHPDDLGNIENAIEKHSGSANPYYESVYRFKAKDSSYKWILSRGMIIEKNPDGTALRMIGTHTDITETKTAEDTYKLLFFSHPSPMWIYDVNTLQIIEVNDSAIQHYGYSREEFLRFTIKDLRIEEEQQKLNTIIETIKTTHETRKDISRHVKKNGDVIYVEVTGNTFNYKGGESRLVTINDITEKIEAEERLKLSEQQYKTLFQNNPLPCWIYDQNTLQILEVNDASVKHYGFTKEEFLTLDVTALQPEEQLDKFNECVVKELQGQVIEEVNWKHKKKNGEIIYVDFKSSSISYNGTAARLIVAHDVTPKVVVEQELRKSNDRFELAAKASREALWEWDIESDGLYLSPVYEEIFGHEIKKGRKYNEWYNYIHPGDLERVKTSFFKALEDPLITKWQEEYRYLKASGEYIFVIDHCIIIRNEKGKALKAIGGYQDISERIKAEEELRNSNERFTYVSKATSDAVYDWNIISDQIEWGDGAFTLFGYRSEDLVIAKWENLLHPEDKEKTVQSLWFTIEHERKKIWKVEYRMKKVDGTYSYVLERGFIIRNSDGKAIRMVGALQDITELKRKEKELLKSNDRYHYAALATSDIIWDWDLNTNEVLWSDNMSKILGWELPEDKKISHSLCFSHVHPEDTDRIQKSLTAFKNDPARTHWNEEYRYQRADGSYAFVSNKAHLLRDHSGEPVRLIGAMQDISEKHYNDALLSLERRVFELSTDNTIPFSDVLNELLKGIEGIHNDAYTSILLLKDDETIEQIASPRIPPAFKQAIDGVKIGPNEGSCGASMHSKQTVIVEDIDTHPLWINFKRLANQFGLKACWSLPIINSSGKVMGSFAIYHKTIKAPTQRELNTVERVRNIIRVLMENHFSLQEIKTANERFDAVLQATHDLIWDWDLETNTIYRDKTGLQNVYGTKENHVINNISEWLKRIHPEDFKKVNSKINKIIESAETATFEMEYRFKRDDGTYSYVYDRGRMIRNAEGKPVRMIGAAQDISERKRLEQILIQKELERQKAINQATVETQEQERSEIGKELHDNVNQVLTTTKLYLDLALSNPEMKDELVQKSVKNIINVINEIRQLSRSLMDPSIGDLGLIDSIHDLVNNINLTRKIHVSLKAGDDIDEVLSKNQKLTIFRIIQEALNNAIRHAKASTVDIHIQKIDNYIRMDIQDDGVGFNPAKVKKGAGLKNIQNRVYLIDGTHSIESQPEHGCTIKIEFPITENL